MKSNMRKLDLIRKNFILYTAVLLALFAAGCAPRPAGAFAIYLPAQALRSADLAQADLAQIALQDQPVISADDVVAYAQAGHEITLTPAAYERLQKIFALPVRVDGIPFVVCVDKTPIYAGAFWTPLSSLSFDGVVILQPFDPASPRIQLTLGYPGPGAFTGRDPRSDPRVLAALRSAGKLK